MREETGFDIRPMLVEEDCIEMHIGQQRSKLFIITGVRSPPSTRPYRCELMCHASTLSCSENCSASVARSPAPEHPQPENPICPC